MIGEGPLATAKNITRESGWRFGLFRMRMTLWHLYHLLLGAVAGFMIGIIPSLIGAIFSEVYAVGVLTICVLVGAITGVMLGEKIKYFFVFLLDGLFELLTIR